MASETPLGFQATDSKYDDFLKVSIVEIINDTADPDIAMIFEEIVWGLRNCVGVKAALDLNTIKYELKNIYIALKKRYSENVSNFPTHEDRLVLATDYVVDLMELICAMVDWRRPESNELNFARHIGTLLETTLT